jgi:hypothetical protein
MKKKILPLFFVLACSINIFALLDSAEVSVPLEMYDNGGGEKTLYFGVDPTATDSIDVLLGEIDLPPFPPAGVFDARWILPIGNFSGALSSWIDYRFGGGVPFADTIIYRLKYQGAEGADTMFFAWDFSPDITARLQDIVTGQIIDVTMAGSGVYGLANFGALNQMKFTVYYNIVPSDVTTSSVPEEFTLSQNYPNPFNPVTTVQFQVPNTTNITIKIFDMLGREVRTLFAGEAPRGTYTVEWDGLNDAGFKMSSGSYIYRMIAGEIVQSKKMILLK